MSYVPYSGRVVDHFERPCNVGRLAPAADVITAAAGEPVQGARFVLSARIAKGRIQNLWFEAFGCPHCIAAGSWLTQRLQGAGCAELEAWSWREAADTLEVPVEKRGRLLILEDAVRALAAEWRGRQ